MLAAVEKGSAQTRRRRRQRGSGRGAAACEENCALRRRGGKSRNSAQIQRFDAARSYVWEATRPSWANSIAARHAGVRYGARRGCAATSAPQRCDLPTVSSNLAPSLGSAQDRFAGGVSKERAARDHGRGRRPRRRDGRPDRRHPYRFQLGRLPRAGRRRGRRGRAGARALPHPWRRARGGGGGRRDELAALPGAFRAAEAACRRARTSQIATPPQRRLGAAAPRGASRSPAPPGRAPAQFAPHIPAPALEATHAPPAGPPHRPHRASRAPPRPPSPPRRVTALRSHGRRSHSRRT